MKKTFFAESVIRHNLRRKLNLPMKEYDNKISMSSKLLDSLRFWLPGRRMQIFIFLIFCFAVSCSTYFPITESKTQNIQVDQTEINKDADLLNLIQPYKQKIEAEMLRVLAISDVELVKDKPESNMTNFMADLLLEEGKEYCRKANIEAPDIAYVNYGGIRSTLPKGEINVQKVFELMPFENEMVLIKISGENFYKMAQKIADRGGDGISGMKLGIKDKAVTSLLVSEKNFDANKSYWIVTNDYVASGGDNMDMFASPESFVSSGITIRSLIIDYLERKSKAGQHISAVKDGRIFYE